MTNASPSVASATGGSEWDDGTWGPIVEMLLVQAARTLERRPELVAGLRAALGIGADRPADGRERMSVAEYAEHRRVCERTVRYMLKAWRGT